VEQLTTLDVSRPMFRVSFRDAAAQLVLDAGQADSSLDRVMDLARVATAVEQVGGAQACLDMTVEYAKTRVQFGRQIGSFQAVKHACADMLVAVESARSAAYHAVSTAVESPDDLPIAAALAKAVAAESFTFVAAQTIQLHGGIGFTWEHDAHLYYRRAHSTALWFGDASTSRELLAQRLGF
jgi:alkylation response protein AidB-like acyl-CoA dehydrogenase